MPSDIFTDDMLPVETERAEDISESIRHVQFECLSLEVLEVAKLDDHHLHAMDAGLHDPHDPAFLKAMPMTIGRFKDAAAAEIFDRCKKWARLEERPRFLPFGGFASEITAAYRRDIGIIHDALWDNQISTVSSRMGRFPHATAPVLRKDNSEKPAVTYMAQIGDLPFGVINDNWRYSATNVQKLIINERVGTRDVDVLRNNGLLQQIRSGDVVMLFNAPAEWDVGTLYCEGAVPERGATSAQFRATGFIAG